MRSWIFLAILILFVGEVRADGVLTTDFVVQLNNRIFEDPQFEFVSRLKGSTAVQLADLVIQDEAPVQVRGVRAVVDYKMNASSPRLTLGAETMLVSESFAIQLTLSQIDIDAIVEKTVGGVLIRARIKGSCSNVQLSIPQGKALLMGSIRAGLSGAGRPVLSVPWFEAAWEANAWQLAPLNCTGVNGFKERVEAGLRNFLATPSAFNAEIRKSVESKIAAAQADVDRWFNQTKMIDTGINGLKLALRPRAILNLKGDQFQLAGDVDFIFPNPRYKERMELRSGGAPKSVALYTMLLPDGVESALMDLGFRSGFLNYRKRGQEIAGFRELLQGSVSKWYSWPELGYFDPSADFLFDFIGTEAPKLGVFTDNGDGSLSQTINGGIDVLAWSPTASGHEKQVRFSTPVNGAYRVSFGTSATTGLREVRAVFSKLNLLLKHEWDPQYFKHVRNATMEDATIQEEIGKSLMSDGFTVEVKDLPLTESLSLYPKALRKIPGWILLDFLER